ncbi:unnamed protein product, partial [Effrenium voratum]
RALAQRPSGIETCRPSVRAPPRSLGPRRRPGHPAGRAWHERTSMKSKETFSPKEPDEHKPELQDVIESIGMGPAQIFWALLGGGIWLADGAELLLVSSVTRSLQKEWQLSSFMKGAIVSAVYVGIFLGNASSGGCSQRFGRREMIVLSYSGIFLCGVLSSASKAAVALMGIRFFGGFFIGIGQPAWLSISAEITPAYWRIAMAAASQSLFVVGEMYISFLLMMDDLNMQARGSGRFLGMDVACRQSLHWRLLLRVGALPSLVMAMLSMAYLNESPVFLALKGRTREACRVVESMGRQNQSTPLSLDFKKPVSHRTDGSLLQQMSRQMAVVFSPRFLGVSLVIMSVCFTLNMVYFGCLFAFPQVLPTLMHGQAASELLVGALWELPGLAMGLLLGISATRRTALKFYLTGLTCAILCFVVGAHGHPEHERLMKALLFIGYYGIKCLPNIGFIVAYQMSAEIYPTEARSMGAGLALACGRLAAMSSPLIFECCLELTGTYLAFFLMMAALCVSNLYMIDFLPEPTRLEHDDVQDLQDAPLKSSDRVQVV